MRRRTLPGGRAVLGALLVALAVVGVVASHVSATAAPRDRYLVAATELPAGTLLGDTATVEASFRQVAVDLPAELAARAVHVDAATTLVGRRLLAALAPGDLLLTSGLAEAGAERGTSTFTFAIGADAAVGGALTVGDAIDVVATTGTGSDATTAYVVRAAPLTAIAATDGGLGGAGLRLTVELARPTEVQALAHALATAEVVVVRSPDATTAAPPTYRYDPSAPGVAPARADDADGADETGGTDETGGPLPLVPVPTPAPSATDRDGASSAPGTTGDRGGAVEDAAVDAPADADDDTDGSDESGAAGSDEAAGSAP